MDQSIWSSSDAGIGYWHSRTREDDDQTFWEAVTARARSLVLSMPCYVYYLHVSNLLLPETHVEVATSQLAVKRGVGDLYSSKMNTVSVAEPQDDGSGYAASNHPVAHLHGRAIVQILVIS